MNKTLILPAIAAVGAVSAARIMTSDGRGAAGRIKREMRQRTHTANHVPHHHEAMVHSHEHKHVTHNRREGPNEVLGEWEHLTASHSHEHNHPALDHSHDAHVDAAHEHLGEAHIHDHERPSMS